MIQIPDPSHQVDLEATGRTATWLLKTLESAYDATLGGAFRL